MATEFEKRMKAQRDEDEYRRQWMAFKRGTPGPMGQVNPYFGAADTRGAAGGGGFGPGGKGFGGGFEAQNAAKRAFALQTGMTKEEFDESLRLHTEYGPKGVPTGGGKFRASGPEQPPKPEGGESAFDPNFPYGRQPGYEGGFSKRQGDLMSTYGSLQDELKKMREAKGRALSIEDRLQIIEAKKDADAAVKAGPQGGKSYGGAGGAGGPGGVSPLGIEEPEDAKPWTWRHPIATWGDQPYTTREEVARDINSGKITPQRGQQILKRLEAAKAMGGAPVTGKAGAVIKTGEPMLDYAAGMKTFKTAEDVKKAVQSGRILKEDGKAILRNKFKYK